MTKVLVVDDETDIRELLTDELMDSGYDVTEAENGAEALNQVYNDRPDIMLLDLNMPVLDGIQVLKTLKSNPFTSKLPVVLLTAVSADEGEQRCMELGANHYVTKPWEPGAIQTVINVTLRETAVNVDSEAGEWGGNENSNGARVDQGAELSNVISTSDSELDSKLGGGLLIEGLTFIEGASSTGKSVLCQQFADAGLVHGYGVYYFSSQYSPTGLVSQMASLGMNSSQYFRSGQLMVTSIPKVGPNADCTEILLEVALRVKKAAANFRFVIIDALTSITNRSEESATVGFVSQCRELANAGSSVIIAAHPADISGESLNRLRTTSDIYLALRTEKNGNRLDNVLEVFRPGAEDYLTGSRSTFEVKPGAGIQIAQPSKLANS